MKYLFADPTSSMLLKCSRLSLPIIIVYNNVLIIEMVLNLKFLKPVPLSVLLQNHSPLSFFQNIPTNVHVSNAHVKTRFKCVL